MNYLGMDVHTKKTVWCLLDPQGLVLDKGKTTTSAPELSGLIQRVSAQTPVLVGQEVGTMCHFVHDVVTAAGAKILSFNAYHLRMICSSRKKTDKRDAYWIARVLQTGIMPHPVYIPDGQVRVLRRLLSEREALKSERQRWQARARSYLVGAGYNVPKRCSTVRAMLDKTLQQQDGIDVELEQSLQLCARQQAAATQELKDINRRLQQEARTLPAIRRLRTIPSVGWVVAMSIYACVGDVSRFPNARELASYAGLVPSVSATGDAVHMGHITKTGSPQLRSVLLEAAQTLISRCSKPEAAPLRAAPLRVLSSGPKRYRVAAVAAARIILRTAFYVLRDQTDYNPALLRQQPEVNLRPAA